MKLSRRTDERNRDVQLKRKRDTRLREVTGKELEFLEASKERERWDERKQQEDKKESNQEVEEQESQKTEKNLKRKSSAFFDVSLTLKQNWESVSETLLVLNEDIDQPFLRFLCPRRKMDFEWRERWDERRDPLKSRPPADSSTDFFPDSEQVEGKRKRQNRVQEKVLEGTPVVSGEKTGKEGGKGIEIRVYFLHGHHTWNTQRTSIRIKGKDHKRQRSIDSWERRSTIPFQVTRRQKQCHCNLDQKYMSWTFLVNQRRHIPSQIDSQVIFLVSYFVSLLPTKRKMFLSLRCHSLDLAVEAAARERNILCSRCFCDCSLENFTVKSDEKNITLIKKRATPVSLFQERSGFLHRMWFSILFISFL